MSARLKDKTNKRLRFSINALGGIGIVALAIALWRWPQDGVGPTSGSGNKTATRTVTGTSDHLYQARELTRTPEPPPTPASGPAIVNGAPNEVAATGTMQSWQFAIQNRNAELVESIDRTFATHPTTFIPLLMISAQTDTDERVRAFSTRVLGKLRATESATLMRALLADKSEYVRFNAAWALGEFVDHDAAALLKKLKHQDRSEMVRRSAENSLQRIGG